MKTENVVVDAYLVELHESFDWRENVKHLGSTSQDEASEKPKQWPVVMVCDLTRRQWPAPTQPPHRVWRDQGARSAACDE